MTPLLDIHGLRKTFGGLIATRDVTLAVPAGEFHALIGPNGAGKTTLITQLFGEMRPDGGSIHFDGHDVTHRPAHTRAALGMARSFQITTLARDLSVIENMLVAVAAQVGSAFRFWQPARWDRALLPRAEAALGDAGLGSRADDRVADLSHGEQRRMELAIALVGNPKLVLLDEPMAGLGAEEGHSMTRYLRSLKGRVTVLLVEHDMDAVFTLADRISVLVRGGLVATGTVDAVRTDPAVRDAYLGEDA